MPRCERGFHINNETVGGCAFTTTISKTKAVLILPVVVLKFLESQ